MASARDRLMEIYLGICYGRRARQREPRLDVTLRAYHGRWSEVRRCQLKAAA